MLIVDKRIPGDAGLAAAVLARAHRVALDWDVRQRSRFDATDTSGRVLGVFLPRGTVVRGGDVLVGEDGSLIRVEAAPQPIALVRPHPRHGVPFDLVRAAYHLGNRHVALELAPGHLKLEPDHVLEAMLVRMGLAVSRETLPFEPEAGAYGDHAGVHGHHHDPAHASDHDHHHAHRHPHPRGAL